MKNLLIWLPLLLIVCTACSEDTPSPSEDYYIKFNVDGKTVRYTGTSLSPSSFNFDQNFQVYNAVVQVIAPGSDGTNSFVNILLRNESAIETNKLYKLTDGIQIASFKQPRILFTWADEKGDIYNAVLLKDSYPNLEIKDEAELTFTKIGNEVLEGKFSASLIGPVSAATGRGNATKIISGGEFRVKFINSNP